MKVPFLTKTTRVTTSLETHTAVLDTSVNIGGVVLRAPVMPASGTFGYGVEFASYVDLTKLGAVVPKSLSPFDWKGNPAPRVTETSGGMLNAIGLQNPGVEHFLEHDLPRLEKLGATVIISIWGRTVADYQEAAELIAEASKCVVALEVNISCPNTEEGSNMFAHSEKATQAVMEATAASGLPRSAKLSPNYADMKSIAAAAIAGGASAITLTNTLLGMAIDPHTRKPILGNGSGGLSGPAVHPVAVRACYEMRKAFPEIGIIGVGGILSVYDALEFFFAGANAVQVGTANFADPAATIKIQNDLFTWCAQNSVTSIKDIVGAAHRDDPFEMPSFINSRN